MYPKKLYQYLNLIVYLFGSIVVMSLARISYSAPEKKAEVSLLSSVDHVGTSVSITFGLHFKLKDGWHTYWRSPGPGVYPLKLNLQSSQNIKSFKLYWPIPERFQVLGISSIGYKDEVVLPLVVNLKEAQKPLKATLRLDYLVCRESQCIPEEAVLNLALSEGVAHPTRDTHFISHYLKLVPEFSSGRKIILDKEVILQTSQETSLLLSFKAQHLTKFNHPKAFLESSLPFYAEAPYIKLSPDGKEGTFTFEIYKNEKKDEKPPMRFLDQKVLLTIQDGVDISSNEAKVVTTHLTLSGIFLLIISALLGGFLLNFMPCVLPVLSLKLFAILNSEKESLKTIREEFILTTAGVVFSFILLGSLAVILKGYGMQVGWGIQFQQPYFLIGISLILLLFTANLWDMFDIRMPFIFSQMASPFMSMKGKAQHFFMGAFLTILATPCTAPFLATAISFSLARGAFEIISIFILIGIGLALPYILVASYPQIATWFPKPGTWMLTFKKVMGGFVFLTFLWILSIMFYQVNLSKFVRISGLFFIIFLMLASLKHFNQKKAKYLLWIGITLIGGILVTNTIKNDEKRIENFGIWSTFEPDKLYKLMSEGKTVFVMTTAEWCLTCKANEKFVLETDTMVQKFKEQGVILMKADWTSPDPIISNFLMSHNEYGVPLYVIYGPLHTKGIKLPQILTQEIIKEALEEVAKKKNI